METVSDVEIDPAGRRVVFRRARYDTGDFSLEEQSGMIGQLFVYELGGEPAHPLIRADHHWDGERLVSFSPDGARAVLNWMERGVMKLGVYEFATDDLRELPFTPAFLRFSFLSQNLIWLSPEEFVCSALPPGEESGAVVYSRRAVGRKLSELWESAWRGDHATADVLESRAGYPEWPQRAGSLVRVNARTGGTRTIADGIYFDLSVSPDGRYLAAARQGGWRQPNPDQPFAATGFRNDFRRYDAVILDLKRAGEALPISPGFQLMLSRYTWGWSPDSRSVVYYATAGDERWSEGSYFRFDVQARRAQAMRLDGLEVPMVRELIDYRYEQAVPFASGIAVPARARSDATSVTDASSSHPVPGRLDWYLLSSSGAPRNLTAGLADVSPTLLAVTGEALSVLADGAVWRVVLNGAPRNITASLGTKVGSFSSRVSLNSPGLSALSVQHRFLVYTRDLSRAVLYDAGGGFVSTSRIPPDIARMWSVAPAAGTAVVAKSEQGGATVLSVVSREGNLRPFWKYNEHLADISPAQALTLHYKLADGTPMTGGALLPPDLKPGMRAPVVVEVYPGLGSSVEPGSGGYHPMSAELLTSMGYILLVPETPEDKIGNDAGALGNWGNLVLPALDALVATGYADPDRVAVWGISQGGWSALAVLAQTNRFKAGIAGFSTGSFLTYYGGSYLMADLFPNEIFPAESAGSYEVVPGSHLSLGATPWGDPARYVRASPFFSAAQIQTPLLLIESDLDAFAMDNLTQMFTALFRLRKEAQLVRYWGEPHGLYSPANIRDYWARQLAWFDRWCDISRDADGRVIFDADRVRSRHGLAPLAPGDFLKWEGFFGDTAAGSADAMQTALIPRSALVEGEGGGMYPTLSGDGRYIAFIAAKEQALNIWVAPAGDVRAARPITDDQHRGVMPTPPFWASDSRHVIYSRDADGDGLYKYYSIDVETGLQVALTPADSAVRASLMAARNARHGTVLMTFEGAKRQMGDLYEVNIVTGKRKLVEPNDNGFSTYYFGNETLPRLALKDWPGGNQELFVRKQSRWKSLLRWGPEASTHAGMTAVLGIEPGGRTALLSTSTGQDHQVLARLDLDTGRQTVVVADEMANVTNDLWLDPRTGKLQAYTTDYLTPKHMAVAPEMRRDIKRLEAELGPQYQVLSRTRDDRAWIILANDPAKGIANYLYQREEGRITKLFEQWPRLAGAPLQPMWPVEIRARDGLILPSYLTLPPGSDLNRLGRPAKPVPMVLDVHGGPSERDIYMFRVDHQWLANRGYAVLSVNFRGSTGLGKRFTNAAAGEMGRKMEDDLVDAVEWAKRERIAQPDRVAILGGSYGGYAALAGLTFTPDLFACGVDLYGPADALATFSDPNTQHNPAQRDYFIRIMGGDPDTEEGRERLKDISPVTYASRVIKPLLIMQGGNDPAVSRRHSDEMVAALKAAGRPVTYVLYPDEGHGLLRRQNRLSSEAIIETFLGRCLGGRVEPIGADFRGSSLQVLEGAGNVLPAAEPARRGSPNFH